MAARLTNREWAQLASRYEVWKSVVLIQKIVEKPTRISKICGSEDYKSLPFETADHLICQGCTKKGPPVVINSGRYWTRAQNVWRMSKQINAPSFARTGSVLAYSPYHFEERVTLSPLEASLLPEDLARRLWSSHGVLRPDVELARRLAWIVSQHLMEWWSCFSR